MVAIGRVELAKRINHVLQFAVRRNPGNIAANCILMTANFLRL